MPALFFLRGFFNTGTDGLDGNCTAIVPGVTAGYRDYFGGAEKVQDPTVCPTLKGFLAERSHT